MKNTFIFFLFSLFFSSAGVAKSKRYVPKKLAPTSNLKKNMKFNNHLVHGKYLHSQDAMAIIEDDKRLSDLLGLRTHFKDRQQDLSKRY